MIGKVFLIGAGPGDPGLLTLRGAELLAQADVVMYDGLCNPDILSHAPNAEHLCVGKHGQQRIWRQDEIIDTMLGFARKGLTVARLKGGDPAVFARTAEEVDALARADIPYEIVPGITAALAASSYAGVPITHRKLASAVAFVTGHEELGKAESTLDWAALARFPGTLIVYMGVTTASVWTQQLIDNGKPSETPVAIIRRCSHDDQQTFHCRLDEVAQRLTPATKIRPPVIVIIGKVADITQTKAWLEGRPLFGKTVMVTRPIQQAEELARPLRELGAQVIIQPAIEIQPPEDWSSVDDAIKNLDRFAYVVFCSRNGVRFFMERLVELGHDVRAFSKSHIACVGKRTAQAVESFCLKPDLVPSDYRAESLAEAIRNQTAGKEVLIVRASRGSNVLSDQLTQFGANVSEVTSYLHTDVQRPDDGLADRLLNGEIDWITMTSTETARNLDRMFGAGLAETKIATLSPVTSDAVRRLGYDVTAEAKPYTINSLIDCLLEAERN